MPLSAVAAAASKVAAGKRKPKPKSKSRLSEKELKLLERQQKLQKALSRKKEGGYHKEVPEGVKRAFPISKKKKKNSLKIKDD